MTEYQLATSSWDDAEIAAMHAVIDSGMFTMGPHVADYERQFADYVGSKHCIMVSSGSAANLLMVAACFFTANPLLKPGDEVIVPAVSWSTTYFPLQQYGLHVKFVDIDPKTLNIDIAKLEDAVSDRTRAILTVNLLGNPNDFEAIARICTGRDILLLEDNCESLGAVFEGKQAGTFGVMGTFSSFFSHHISTMEGGCVVTDDEELYHILLSLRAHGWTRNLPSVNRVTGTKSEDAFEESFKFVLPGYNVRPLELSGAIGKEQLKKLPSFIEQRRSNASVFVDLFGDHPWLSIQEETGQSSWFGFSLVVAEDAPVSRRELVTHLGEKGIQCRPIVTGNFVKNERVLQYFDYEVSGELAAATLIDERGLFVGNQQVDIAREIHYLRDVVDGML